MDDAAQDEEDLYDAYLDACLSGAPPTPSLFLEAQPEVSADLRARLVSAYKLAVSDGPDTETTGEAPFERLGGYRIQGRLGVGGMGSVYLADQESLGRTVALKVIRGDLRTSDTMQRRFEREARAVAKLRHPNIVNVYEFGRDGEWDYIAMELVAGRPMDAVLREAPPAVDQVLGWGVQLAQALGYAHDEGVVHRDIKPQNVMVTPGGRPVLLDFGLARMTGTEMSALTHEFAGTPQYAAPEQLTDDASVDGRTDVYALGVLLYEALTGRLPYEAGRIDELLLRIVRDEPLAPRKVNPALPVDVETVVLKMMEKDPARRYATAWDAAQDLQRILDVKPVQARRPGSVAFARKWIRRHPAWATVLAALVVAMLATGAVLWRGVLEDRDTARNKVAEARQRVDAMREARLAVRSEEVWLRTKSIELGTRWHTPEELEQYEARLDAVEGHRRARRSEAAEVLDLLRDAQARFPDVQGVEPVRAALLVELSEGARVAGDTVLETAYRQELAALPEATAGAAAEAARGTIEVVTDPPGASVQLFRYETLRDFEPDGDRRLVPVPVMPQGVALPDDLPLGSFALRVGTQQGPLEAGDLVTRVFGEPVHGVVFAAVDSGEVKRGDALRMVEDRAVTSMWDVERRRLEQVRALIYERGGRRFEVLAADVKLHFTDAMGLLATGDTPVEIVRNGVRRTLHVKEPAYARPTAAPRVLLDPAVLGTTPLGRPLAQPAGRYAVLVRKEGYEDQLVVFGLAPRTEVRHVLKLLPAGTTPPGYVFVPGADGVGAPTAGGRHAFWMKEQEVTVGEFAAFLSDRAGWHGAGALERFRNVSNPSYVPHFAMKQKDRGAVRHMSDGTFQPFSPAIAVQPVVSVSFDIAKAYARWLSAKTGHAYDLPTLQEWLRAGGGDGRRYPFGNDFRPGWVRSLAARPSLEGGGEYEPTRRFPIDESPLGVYGMAGNASELLDQPWGGPQDGRLQYTGGSTEDGSPEAFRLGGGGGVWRDIAVNWIGFRLVIRTLKTPR